MTELQSFSIARLPRIVFGPGCFHGIPKIVAGYGQRVLIVTGAKSLRASKNWESLLAGLRSAGMTWEDMRVAGEPSPQRVDEAVAAYRGKGFEVVLGVGGGSVLDAAKAIAGLLKPGNSVLDHLEGVGPELPYKGPTIPFVAVPTTAGTGSEATKNAVLSVQGKNGFKKSFRDEALVAQEAVVDPELLCTCPPEVIAANGMDALTQLLESYVSSNANPFTDALALSGLKAVRDGLIAAWRGGDSDEARRGRVGMAYGSLLSGITLAQVGLGSVHGLASPIGAYFPIPHGVVCGTLVAKATEVNIRAMREREPENASLVKYARAEELLTQTSLRDREVAWDGLVRMLNEWTSCLKIQTLSHYGIKEQDIDKIVAGARGSSMKTNPIVLTDAEIGEVVRARL
jgi:alcohol dehydrogenase class IV